MPAAARASAISSDAASRCEARKARNDGVMTTSSACPGPGYPPLFARPEGRNMRARPAAPSLDVACPAAARADALYVGDDDDGHREALAPRRARGPPPGHARRLPL